MQALAEQPGPERPPYLAGFYPGLHFGQGGHGTLWLLCLGSCGQPQPLQGRLARVPSTVAKSWEQPSAAKTPSLQERNWH